MINDLLTIGKERTELGIAKLEAVHPHEVLNAILPLFSDQALLLRVQRKGAERTERKSKASG